MPIAIDPNAVTEFKLKAEADMPSATVFLLRPLTARELTRVAMPAAQAGELSGLVLAIGPQSLDLLRYGLQGWRGFNDASGVPVPFQTAKGAPGERDIASDASIDRIPSQCRQELALAIFTNARLSADERRD